MTRIGSFQRCAYAGCNKTTDKRSFGRIRALFPAQLTSYSSWLKPLHDGVLCDYHYTLLRRLLKTQLQQQEVVGTGMDELSAAAAAMSDTSSSTEPSDSTSPVLPSPTVTVTIRSQSLPPPSHPPSLSTASPPGAAPLRRSTSTPLLPMSQRGCDPRQRKRIAFTCAMSGVTWTTWNRLEANLNSQSLSKATWYRLTQDVWKAIEAVRDDCSNAYIQQLLAANQPIVVVADGAWSHRGFTAGQHDWVLLNAADSKAIFSIPLYRSRMRENKVIHQGNYDDGSSRGMEGYALDMAIQRLQTSGLAALITGWVGDQDSSVLKQLRECPAAHKWQVHLDPGHAKKNLVNALTTLFGEKKEFDGLARRIPVFILRCTKRAEKEHAGDVNKMREQFCSGWTVWCPITHNPVELHCPHHQQDDVEQSNVNPTATSASKSYLRPNIHGAQIALLQSLIDRMKQSARYFIHGFNTCNTERYHRERLKLTPKALEFWKTWAPRCALNQVIHNCGYAEAHRLVLAKLGESAVWAPCILGIHPGNRYQVAMDVERVYHSARKSKPAYNRREDQLAREFGKRRAAHDRTSQCRGHDYHHSPPLYNGNAGEEPQGGTTTRRKPRRSKEQIEQEKTEKKAESQRLRALFDGGDVTFTTLGVIDVNLVVIGKGRKKKREKGEEPAAGKENGDQSAPAPSQKRRSHDEQTTPTVIVTVAEEKTSTAARPDSSAARAILFR